eukprot:1383623-Prymnesium_polylepis.1
MQLYRRGPLLQHLLGSVLLIACAYSHWRPPPIDQVHLYHPTRAAPSAAVLVDRKADDTGAASDAVNGHGRLEACVARIARCRRRLLEAFKAVAHAQNEEGARPRAVERLVVAPAVLERELQVLAMLVRDAANLNADLALRLVLGRREH